MWSLLVLVAFCYMAVSKLLEYSNFACTVRTAIYNLVLLLVWPLLLFTAI